MERLVSIKGLGPWSVEMFLLFGLVRMDVFSVGDLGVRRGLAHYLKYFRPDLIKEMRDEVDWENVLEGKFGKPNSRKYPKSKPKEGGSKAKWQEPGLFELAYVAEKFRPYRTAFMMVLWELSMVDLGIFTEKK
ncbi:hypothetical protein NADFUDRAFT_84253 [Nadsonia fulvescens var. elongata DSM 6958]|uniref:DNA glycosylase n=1 Tax=Nadsonia fulvescens var. elongata DSM 6958 TaxID=857566 RepID=A0A1E3PDX2_9ASCO|nr:hypothetical protein NADFUDRAFT_84253 [Nadsonia fulvescens var. elongata DSM 6958]